MPVQTDLPRIGSQEWSNIQANDLYRKLPFWIAANNSKMMTKYSTWQKLTGTLAWRPNQGTQVKGVRAEPTPVSRQFLTPNRITAIPVKDVFEVRETEEDEFLYRQNFESKAIHFLDSFEAWRDDQIGFALKDISAQIAVAQDLFIRTHMWYKSPAVMFAGASGQGSSRPEYDPDVPALLGNKDNNLTGSKNLDWLGAVLPSVRERLSLRTVMRALAIMAEDIQAPPFENAAMVPVDDEGLKGKYCLVGSTEAHTALWDDPELRTRMKSDSYDVIKDGWGGTIAGLTRWKFERFPMRIKYTADVGGGDPEVSFPVPQLIATGGYNEGETIPNPEYTNPEIAQYEVAWLLGADSYRTLKVGPAPSDFSASERGVMSASAFKALRWNGEVRVIKDFLVDYVTPDGGVEKSTNMYGDFLKLIADVTYGSLPINRRYCMPIIFNRSRVAQTAPSPTGSNQTATP